MPLHSTSSTVLVPYVKGMLRTQTYTSVLTQRKGARLIELPATSPTAYGKLLISEVTPAQVVVIVEQDIVAPRNSIRNLVRCRHGWCIHRYLHTGKPIPAGLGLAKFAPWLHTMLPRWIECALLGGLGSHRWPHWKECDGLIERWLRGQGLEPHVHRPDAGHLHGPPDDTATEWMWPLITPGWMNPHAPSGT